MAEKGFIGLGNAQGEYKRSTRANPALLSDPFGFAEDATEGVGHGILKAGYDTFAFGSDVTTYAINKTGWNPVESLLPDFGVTLEEEEIPYAETYWDALENAGSEISNITPTTKGFTEVTALLTSTRAAAARLAQVGKFKTLLESSKKWDKLKASLYVGSISGAAADLIHTRASDLSMFELIPEQYQTETMKWWMDKSDDSELTGRLKNMLEGSAIGVVADSVFSTLGYLLKSSKDAVHASTSNPEEILQMGDEFFGSGNREVMEKYLQENSTIGRTMGDELASKADQLDMSGIADEVSWKQIRNSQRTGRGLDYRARKGRAAKKQAKKLGVNSYTDSSLDNLYVPKEIDTDLADSGIYADTASSARIQSADYSISQVNDHLPVKDTLRKNVDATVGAVTREATDLISSTNRQLDQYLNAKLLDPTTTLEDRKTIEGMINMRKDTGSTELNAFRSGDDGIYEGVELVQILKLVKDLPNPLTTQKHIQLLEKTTNAMINSDVGVKAVNYAKTNGLDANALLRQLANLKLIGLDAEVVMTASAARRSTMVANVQSLAKKLKGVDVSLTDKRVDDLLRQYLEVDRLDHALQGARGINARLLGNNRMNSGSFSELLSDVRADAEIKISDGVHQPTKAEKLRKYNLSLIEGMLETKDKKALQSFINKILKGDLSTNKAMNETLKPKTIMDWIQAWFYGNMLGRTGTLFGSVGIGGAAATTWKQIVEPAFQAALNVPARIGLGTDSGHRMIQSIIGAKVLAKQTLAQIGNVFSGGTSKPLADFMNVGGLSVREGAENAASGFKELGTELADTAKYYADNGYYKTQTMINLMAPLVRTSQSVNNVFLRGIQNTDNFFKGLNNESSMLQEANRIWYKEGGSKGAIKGVTKKAFMDDYMDIMRKVVAAQKESVGEVAKKKAIDRIFKPYPAGMQKDIADSLAYAKLLGEQATLQQSTHEALLGKVVKSLEAHTKDSNAGRLTLMMMLPFRKTPINLLTEVLEMSPIAWTTKRWRAALSSGSPEERIRVLGKMAAGSTLLYSLANYVSDGRIQGRIKPEDRDRMARMGRKEHSVLIGNSEGEATWWSYSKLGPLASLISVVDEVHSMRMSDPDASSLLMLSAAFSIAADDTHMSTYKEFIEFVQSDNPIKDGTRLMFNRAANQITPSGGTMSSLEDMIAAMSGDDVKRYRSTTDREVGGLLNEVQSQLLNATKNQVGWRMGADSLGFGAYDTELSVTGDDMYKYSKSGAGRFFSLLGIGSQDARNDPLSMELERHRLIPSNSSQSSIDGVKMTANEHKTMWKDMMFGGTDTYRVLNDLVTSNAYKSAPLGTRRSVLSKALTLRKDYMKEAFIDGSPRLKEEIYKKKVFELVQESRYNEADYESLDYYMDGKSEAFKTNSTKAPAVDKGLKELGIEVPEDVTK